MSSSTTMSSCSLLGRWGWDFTLILYCVLVVFFFFQAEDGIRDYKVTGVQKCALPIFAIDWNGLPVTDVYPKDVRDLFSAKPVIITGRYSGTPTGKITIKGYQGTGDYSRTIPVDFSSAGENNAALEKIWARHKVEDLMSQDWNGIQSGNSKYKAQIIQVGLEHGLATQFTSFVAVEERTIVSDGKPVKVEVPVELPEGVSPLAVPGQDQ